MQTKDSTSQNQGSNEPAQQQVRRRPLRKDDVVIVEKRPMKQAIGGTVVGNFMEWFDFGIYGYLAVVMTHVFTEGLPQQTGLIIMLLGFAVSFLVRPLGGLVLGPLGDRIGRQKVLFITMGMMALATALIGLLPTAAQIGLWATVPLYLLKMVQGFSTGGEYAGATTYVSEFSPDKRRGYFASWLDVGSYLGFAAGAATVAITTVIAESAWGEQAMVNGGWRIPYLVAIPLGAVAIYLRTRIPETPHFEDEQSQESESTANDPMFQRLGIVGIMRNYWREVLIGIAIVAATNTAGYALTSYMPSYLETEVGTTPTMAAAATVPVLVVMSLCLPLIGRLSDRIGRRPVYGMAVISTLVLMVPAFMLMHVGTFWAIQGALVLVAIPVAFYVAISAATLPALFPTASRFGAMAISYNVAVALFGGTTPVFSQGLIALTGNHYMPAFYIMFFGLLGGIAMLCMRESAKRPLLGSMPTVETEAEARRLVRDQKENPYIDTRTMPLQVVDGSASHEKTSQS
ncbi:MULTISPECIES: MFS transporter [unclassified Pseudoclavibacter]|uniref:MFS transporter n=1 Tax=unclassified Pseudoclavibacter TaxID=2615177 RepID=UPI0013018D06|nr:MULTISPECIES: MFS transporter [unclassified Pseudoclavibacter]KAB1645747.1 MFS transporter [Pseudoclavibacter sp. CFCC 14310]KAB1664345.1 MFS transporter [Pseudoclavibacter sp. CFCC 13611]